jgi:hypothetical protein
VLAVCQIKIFKLDRSPILPLQCAGGKFNQADYKCIVVDNQARRFAISSPSRRTVKRGCARFFSFAASNSNLRVIDPSRRASAPHDVPPKI